MRNQGIINPQLCAVIAGLGHTETIVIADSGLPIPAQVQCIDLSLTYGTPSFLDVLKAVEAELCIESYTVAEEMAVDNPDMLNKTRSILCGKAENLIPHSVFKKKTAESRAVIRTGENTPYSNVILKAGVVF